VVPIRFNIVSCASCRHIRVDPRIADERLEELYDEAYYRGDGFDATIDYGAPPSQATIDENVDIVHTVAEAAGGSVRGLRWLDIGCGTGALLESAAERGAIVTGSDSSDAASISCRGKGLPFITPAALIDYRKQFDVVSAIEVIEHVPDPMAFVLAMKSYVREGGIVFLRTGNWNVVRYLPGTPYVMPEGHIQYFTPRTIRRIFAAAMISETATFNRTWFVWRLIPKKVRARIPHVVFSTLARISNSIAPGLAPFPIGRVAH